MTSPAHKYLTSVLKSKIARFLEAALEVLAQFQPSSSKSLSMAGIYLVAHTICVSSTTCALDDI